jgi:hypothetical protein
MTKSKSLDRFNTCAVQPYLSGNQQIDLLLRNHNWAGNINTPVEIKYTINLIDDIQQKHSNPFGFWENEARAVLDTIEYISKAVSFITGDHSYYFDSKYIPEYIVADSARDQYQLYEGNYDNSDSQEAYVLEVKLENIKRKLDFHQNNTNDINVIHSHPIFGGKKINVTLQQFQWIRSIDSILDLQNQYIKYDTKENQQFKSNSSDNPIPYKINQQEQQQINLVIDNIFNSAASAANINFTRVSKDPDLELNLSVGKSMHESGIPEGGSETLYFEDGKTIHAKYTGSFYLSDKELSSLNWLNSFHEITHVLFDHPQDSVFARELYLHEETTYSAETDQEYRASSSCMSVMNTIYKQGCIFAEKTLYPISYLPIDIQALQHMYGVNLNTRSSDTTYILTNEQTFIEDVNHPLFAFKIPTDSIYTLYDAGGINTLDLSLVNQAKIDLNQGAGHFNSIGDNIFLIAYGTNIHNVVVGSGDIAIKLNQNLNSDITIASNGAHVTIEGFDKAQHNIILAHDLHFEFEALGCIKPYSQVADHDTEICFI